MTGLLPEYPQLRYLRHGTRAGQSSALRTGILTATSPVIVIMDGDGQNDPNDISMLLEHLGTAEEDGTALVSGIRTNRRASTSRRFASVFANWIRDRMLRDDCPDTGCGIKVFYRETFLRLPFFTSMHRFLPALFRAYDRAVQNIPVNDRPRLAGVSKYNNFKRALIGLYDLFGVRWLIKRTKTPAVAEDSAGSRRWSKTG